jgi:hypothetical protein
MKSIEIDVLFDVNLHPHIHWDLMDIVMHLLIMVMQVRQPQHTMYIIVVVCEAK